MKRSGNNLSSLSSVSGSNNIGNRKPFNKVNVPKPVNLPIAGNTTGTNTSNSTTTTNTTLNNSNIATNTNSGTNLTGNNSTTSTLNNANSTPNNAGNAWNTRQLQSSWFQNNPSSSGVESSSTDPINVSQSENNNKPTTINTTPSLPVRSTRTPITPTKDTNNNNSASLTPQTTTNSNNFIEETSHHEKKQTNPAATTHTAGHDSNWGEIYDDDDDFYDSDLEELIEKENKTNAPTQAKTKKQKYLEKKKLLREQQMLAEKSHKSENSEPKTVSTPSNNTSNSPSKTSPNPQNSLPSSPPCLNIVAEEPKQQIEQTEEAEVEETEQEQQEIENPVHDSPPSQPETKEEVPKQPTEPQTSIPPKNTPVTSHRPPSFFSIGRTPKENTRPSHPSTHPIHTTDNHVPKILPAEPQQDTTKPKEEIIKTIKEQEVLLNETAERRRREKEEEEDRIERERKERALSKLKELEKKLAEKKPAVPEPVAQPVENTVVTETSNTEVAGSSQQNGVKILKPHHNNGGHSTRGNHHGRGGSTHKTQRPTSEQTPKVQHEKVEEKSITDTDNNWRSSNVKLTKPPFGPPQTMGKEATTTASSQEGNSHTNNHGGRGGHSTRGRPNTRGGHTNRNPRKQVDNENNVPKSSDSNSAIDLSNVLKNINPNEAKNKISFGMFDEEPKVSQLNTESNASQPATTQPENFANPRPERPHTGKPSHHREHLHKRNNPAQPSTESVPNTTTRHQQPHQNKPPRQKHNNDNRNNENQTHPKPRRNHEFVKNVTNEEVKSVPADSAPEQKEIQQPNTSGENQTGENQRSQRYNNNRRGNHHNGTPRTHHEKPHNPKSRICFVKVDNTTSQE